MGMDPETQPPSRLAVCLLFGLDLLTVLAAVVGLVLIAHESLASSATYDEVAYLRMAARWWRTGDQTEITRMGSPLTFWKLQQVPVLWLLDHAGHRDWVDDPISHQQELLPWARLGSSWIWLWLSVSRLSGAVAVMALGPWHSRPGFSLEPQSSCPRCACNHGTSVSRRHHGHVLLLLAVSRDQPSIVVLGCGRGWRSGIFV